MTYITTIYIFGKISIPGRCFSRLIYKMCVFAFHWYYKLSQQYVHVHAKHRKRGSRVVSALASCARGPGFDPRQRRGKFVGPNTLPLVSFAGMT